MSSPEPNEENFERLSQALRKAEARQKIFVPPTLDKAILKQARQQFEGKSGAGRRSNRNLILRWLLTGGAVAVLALGIFVFERKPAPLAREDINGDGRVDILDALALAKALEGKTNNLRFDQNGDRKLDDSDVRAVAFAAVRLDRKPGT